MRFVSARSHAAVRHEVRKKNRWRTQVERRDADRSKQRRKWGEGGETGRRQGRTLDLGDGGGEDVLLRLVVAEALEDGVNDGLAELSLLALLRLLLKADPRVEDGLDFCCECDLLALDERLGLELGGLLRVSERKRKQKMCMHSKIRGGEGCEQG